MQPVAVTILQSSGLNAASFVDARVRVTGVLTYDYDAKENASNPHLWVTDASSLRVVDYAPARPVLIKSVRALVSDPKWVMSGRRVRLAAKVLARESPRDLLVESGGISMPVDCDEADRYSAGDIVEIVGWPVRGVGTTKLFRATVEKSSAPLQDAEENEALPVLTNIGQIRHLRNDDAEQGFPVDLIATVTYLDNGREGFFVNDRDNGIYIDWG
jgi:hypothetical protein